jgi:hypothetical protein
MDPPGQPHNMPIVFISSSSEDLKSYRSSILDAALGADFHPIMMELVWCPTREL